MVVTLSVRDVMQTSVVTASPDDPTVAAARLLDEEDVGSVVIVDDAESVVGILTEDDVVRLFVDGGDVDAPVSAVMSAPVETVEADATLSDAAARMSEEGVTNLPVCDDGALVGVVSRLGVSYYFPVVAHPPDRSVGLSERRRETRPDTAYEADEWDFESYGAEDGSIEVGDSVSFSKDLDEDDVIAFADASGDTNRLHLDEAYAEGTRFGRRIVHGTLVAGTISAALARLPGLTVYLSQETTYRGPVDVGERVTARCEVVESLGENRYRLTTEVTREDGELVVEGDAVVISDPIPETA